MSKYDEAFSKFLDQNIFRIDSLEDYLAGLNDIELVLSERIICVEHELSKKEPA